MRAKLERSGPDDSGQALAEYGIALAVVSGASAAAQAVGDFIAEPNHLLMVGAAFVVVLLFIVRR